MVLVGGHLPKKIYVFLIMMKYDDLYFASRYNFFTDCVEWYFLPKTDIYIYNVIYSYITSHIAGDPSTTF